ncbi:hypothetical protein [Jiangella anatolica]|uniref:Uncharacterized protein n=1 Tax=Jiangella anatolica TaxID=2670374 RepID=A0A2W2CVC4_9ACTN|nr:hypothetical protein [Jiangella anatolica]PZF84173.1 hypothetical protein C1I92_10000 [Jiangella anatolica]
MIDTEVILINPKMQAVAQRLSAWFEIPLNTYTDQREAMDHAHSIASRTKHRMEVRMNRSGEFYIRLGKGPLT